MSNKPNEYITSDGQVFKTTLDLAGVNPKDYALEDLERAEARVIRGTNKTLQTALNSIVHLRKGSKKKVTSAVLKDMELDEYGLDSSLYTEAQTKFIHRKVKEYEAVYDTATPFARDTVIEMAKNRLKNAEVEAKMISSDFPGYIKQKADLRKDFSSMAEDLKLLPKQKKDEDRSKNRNSLSEMVRRYEARRRSQRKETNVSTKKMDELLSEVRVNSLDGKYAGAEE
jgi:adenylate kinase family enzyme